MSDQDSASSDYIKKNQKNVLPITLFCLCYYWTSFVFENSTFNIMWLRIIFAIDIVPSGEKITPILFSRRFKKKYVNADIPTTLRMPRINVMELQG